jgi:hypothetical protein
MALGVTIKDQNWGVLLQTDGVLFLWVESIFFLILVIVIFCRKNRYQDRLYVARKRKGELLDRHSTSPRLFDFVKAAGPDKLIKTYNDGYKRRKLELKPKARRAIPRRKRHTIEEVDEGFEVASVSLSQRYVEARQKRREVRTLDPYPHKTMQLINSPFSSQATASCTAGWAKPLLIGISFKQNYYIVYCYMLYKAGS